MKKYWIIGLLSLLACKKEQPRTNTESVQRVDSAVAADAGLTAPADSSQIKDSVINNAPATKEVLRTGVMRDVTNKMITREADAEQLPFSIGEEFTEDGQKFILKIKNVAPGRISAKLTPADAGQNIRIEEIRLPDGTQDGLSGLEISRNVAKQGEVSLVIGSSNRESGTQKGQFSVYVEAN